jgi:hypothetical protein
MDRQGWVEWFQFNRSRPEPGVPDRVLVDRELHAPLVRALQVFQRGETGEARVVGELARSGHPAVDAMLIAALTLHLKEEGRHARELKLALKSLGAPIVGDSRAERLFRVSRRAFGPFEELVVLGVAEVVGMAFYQTLGERLPQADLARTMRTIARDEAAHLDFLCDVFTEAAQNTPATQRPAAIARWSALFVPGIEAGALLVAAQHRHLLHLLGTDGRTLRRRCKDIVDAQRPWSGQLRGPARALREAREAA